MKYLVTLLLVLAFAGSLLADDTFYYKKVLPADSSFTGIHGVAVDPDGKVWVMNYQDYIDSIQVAGEWKKSSGLHVYDHNGAEVAFSPIFFAGTDTLVGYTHTDGVWNGLSCRGMRTAADGNILVSVAEKWPYNNQKVYIYKFNYTDGSFLGKINLSHDPADGAKAGTAPGVATGNGHIFTGYLYPGFAVQEYDADLNLIGEAITSESYTASFEVSADGNTIYWTPYAAQKCYVWTRPDEFSSFAKTDSLGEGLQMHSSSWDPATGYLWLSSNVPSDTIHYSKNKWYAFDVTTKQVMDSIAWNDPVGDMTLRGLAFSPDGRYAYGIAQNGPVGIQVYQKTGTDIGWEYSGILGEWSS